MASMVIGGLFNAVAFAGAGFLFNTFNKHGYSEEIKRHNTAMEKLSADKEKFYQEETLRRNKQEELRQKIFQANMDTKQTNNAFLELKKVNREPKLDDYYTPSSEMKKYQIGAISIIGTGAGILASWLI